jgi:hypothetical protein
MRRRAFLLVLVSLPLLVVLNGTAEATHNANTFVSAQPAAGAPGAVIAVSGGGFRANRSGTLTLGARTVGSFTTTGTGTFATTFVVPNMAPRTRRLKATVGPREARTPFEVLAATSTSTTTTATTSTTVNPTSTTATTRTSTTTTTTTTSAPPPATWWRPEKGSAWQIQLTTPVDLSVDAPIFEIDGADNPKSVVDQLHAMGRRAICYIDVGGAENYRDDYHLFPESVLGNTVDGWPDERWVDIRQIELLTPVMTGRMDMCRQKGFDAVDPDLMEAYAADSGFPLTYGDQLRYNRWIAGLAHERGMGVALKQDIDQVKDLWADFDFAVNEQCFQYDECDLYRPVLDAGKAVFEIEYNVSPAQFCPNAERLGIFAMRKRLSLNAYRELCP